MTGGATSNIDSSASAQSGPQTLVISSVPTEFTGEIDRYRTYATDAHRVEDDEDDAFENIIDLAIPHKGERKAEPPLANLDTAGLGGGLSSVEFAEKLYEQFVKSGNIADLDAAVAFFRKGIAELPEESAVILNNLGCVLKARFKHGGQQIDLDEAISRYRQALELLPPPHPNRSELLTNLANAFETRFEQGSRQIDLDEAISFHRQALNLRLSHPNRSDSLNSLATALWTKFEQKGQHTDLDEAISLFRQSLDSPPHSNRCDLLSNLGAALLSLFEQKGQQIHLDEAISLHRQALDLPHPNRSSTLNNLANALWTRFEQNGQQTDLDEAISLYRQSLNLRLPHSNRSLSNLASALRTRFGQRGQQNDLDEAISLHRQALKLFPPLHPKRYAALNNLASALRTRFEQRGQHTDLDEAIALHRQAFDLLLPPHPDRPHSLNNLATVLSTRFKQKGQQIDLDEAISLHRQALELFPPPHPNRSISLSNLASALQTRFGQRGQKIDLDEVISLLRQALDLQPPPHPIRSHSLSNLGAALLSLFEQKGQQIHLDEAISLHRQAFDLIPPLHPNRSESLSNLAGVLLTRFEQKSQQVDVNEAVSLLKQALELRLPPHPDHSASLGNLASALWTRFKQKCQHTDLDEAISLCRQALDLRPPSHPNRSLSLAHLAVALSTRFEQGGQQIDLDEAMSAYRTATQCPFQPPSRLLDTAKKWIQHADRNEHISVIDAYDTALQALPQVAALSFDVQSRQEALAADSDGLARDGSRCAIRTGNLDKAIEFLEAGRNIFWTQVLSLRSPFNQLHDVDPELANKMREIATALELGSHRDVSIEILDNLQKLSVDQEVSRLNRLSEEWVKSIDQVRTLKGFEDFLRPARISSLKSAASRHPVVFLVASHCLIMTSTSIHHIPLPNLDIPILKALVHLVQVAVHRLPISRSIIECLGEERGTRPFQQDKLGSSDDVFRHVLRILWDELVKPVIKFLDIKKFTKSSEMPILQWCPIGHFTFLPIHAAGYYEEQAIECVADYFISSYTPTVGALLAHPPTPSTHTFKMMVVIQTEELPSTRTELENIQRHVPSDSLVIFGVPGTVANVETVASCLSEASIVHFACHGTQDRLKPLNSGLKLDDGLLRISRIMKEKSLDGSLAFLCACETAMGDEKLPDEAMSLGASLLFSGFHSVIATMWEMADKDGPIVADAFYEELFRGPDVKPALEPDTTKSAQALHFAVKKLRSQNASFGRWIPFIHIGK